VGVEEHDRRRVEENRGPTKHKRLLPERTGRFRWKKVCLPLLTNIEPTFFQQFSVNIEPTFFTNI
jgi:hypothetical protein